MEKLRHNIVHTALGAISGAAGLAALARCSGGVCTSCFGCAGAGIGVLLIAAVSKLKEGKDKNDGVA